jgi:hypothetical protein
LSTIKLLDLLKHAIDLQAADSNVPPKKSPGADNVIGMLDAILHEIGEGNTEPKGGDFGLCIPCSRRRAVIKCSEGHALCVACIEVAILEPGANTGDRHLPCLMDGCSSQPFQDRDLRQHIKHAVYAYFFGVKQCVDKINEGD